MRKNCQFQRVEDDCSIADNSLVVALLNIRSLTKHGIDVSYDKSIMESDIIAFTETQLSHDRSLLDQDLHPLTLITNNLIQNSYSNVAFAHKDTLSLLKIKKEKNDIHMIFGDFNISALEGNDYMSQYLSNYKIIVISPSHISGSLLDHVFVLHNFFENFKVTNYIKSVYFSDHDAVKCIIEKVHE